MNENAFNQNIQEQKPVNINISFNISRKQVNQNLNPFEEEKSFHLRNNINDDNGINSKSKNPFYRVPKTPQLAQTDRNIYSKDLEYLRPTEELKRKKKRKRSTGDFNVDKTTNFPFYPNELQKSLPNHKRGYTTALINKKSATGTKPKKSSNKTEDNFKQRGSVPFMQYSKSGGAQLLKPNNGLQKNLKSMINKLINTQLSKRSLPLPMVANKSKYNISQSLTSRKMPRTAGKKKSSKCISSNKQRSNQSVSYNKYATTDRVIQKSAYTDRSDYNNQDTDGIDPLFQKFNRKEFIEKLSSFKSAENSYLMSEVDRQEEESQCEILGKVNKNKTIVIKTDQSMDCIGQIHNIEKDKYQKQFFINEQENPPLRESLLKRSNQTAQIIQTYINLLNQSRNSVDHNSQQEGHKQSRKKPLDSDQSSYYRPSNVQFNPNDGDYLGESDYNKMQQMMLSNNKQKSGEIIKQLHNLSLSHDHHIQQLSHQQTQSKSEEQQVQEQEDYISSQVIQYEQSKHTHKQQSQMTKSIGEIEAQQVEQKQLQNRDDEASKWMIRQTKSQLQPSDDLNEDMVESELIHQNKNTNLNKFSHFKGVLPQSQSLKSQYQNQQNIKFNNEREKKKQQQVDDSILKPFISSEMIRDSQKSGHTNALINSSDRHKLNEIKKQQIQKWGYLLEFIKSNINNKQANTQEVLEQVYTYLESAKRDLQKEGQQVISDIKKSSGVEMGRIHHKKDLQEQFTNKLSSQYQKSSQKYKSEEQKEEDYEEQQQEEYDEDIDEQVRSFKEDYSQNDEQIKHLNLETIESALKSRFNILTQRKSRQISLLQQKLENNKINIEQFSQQKQKVQKWIKQQTNEILKVKKNIWKGYNEAKSILDKSYLNSKYIQDSLSYQSKSNQKKMMKCLSQTYLSAKKNIIDYKKFIEQDNQSKDWQQSDQQQIKAKVQQQSDEEGDSAIEKQDSQNDEEDNQQEEYSENYSSENQRSIGRSSEDQIQKLNKKLMKMKQQHYLSLTNQERAKYQQDIDLKLINQFEPHESEIPKHTSPDSNNSNPMSPTSIHYEQLEREIHSGQNSDQDDYIQPQQQQDYYKTGQKQQLEYKESDSDEEQNEEERQIINDELRTKSQTITSNPFKDQKQKQPIVHSQNPFYKKLKYLTEQDREDIFEFLFLDLCIELYQQPCRQNKIMQSINDHVIKVAQLAKRKKGVKTNLNVVKDYLKRFCGYLIRTNKPVLNNLNVPMGPTAIQMLKYMHENDDVQEEPLQQGEGMITLIVPIQSFDTFERSLLPTLEFEKYYEDEDKETERVNFLKNILHIHNKALFDALNQFLDQQRPFGIWGKPFPWKKSSSFSHKFSQIELEQKLKKSAQKVVEACSYVCGLLVDKQESLVGNAKLTQGYIEQIRQDRISRMLANDMIENQDRWVFYDDQETQVLVQAGQSIYNKLIRECIEEIASIRGRDITSI